MTIAAQLKAIRQKYDAGQITTREFMTEANAALNSVFKLSDEEKAKAFDKIAETLLDFFTLDEDKRNDDPEEEDGEFYVKDDHDGYVSEAASKAIFGGDEFFDFYNATYYSC